MPRPSTRAGVGRTAVPFLRWNICPPSAETPGQELTLQPNPTVVPLLPTRPLGALPRAPDKPTKASATPYCLTQEGPGSNGLSGPGSSCWREAQIKESAARQAPGCQGSVTPGPRDLERKDVRMNTGECMHTLLHNFCTSASLPTALPHHTAFWAPSSLSCRAHCGLPQSFLRPPRALPRGQARVARSHQCFTITNNAAMNNPVHVQRHTGYFHGSVW